MKSKPSRLEKKGSMLDIIWIMIAMFTLAITIMVAWIVWDTWKTNGVPELNLTQTPSIVAGADTTIAMWDYLFLFIFIGVVCAATIGAFMINTHPIFFIVSMFVMILSTILAGSLSNSFEAFTADATVSTAASHYTIIPNIIGDYPLWMLVAGALIIIALYTKSRGENEGM